MPALSPSPPTSPFQEMLRHIGSELERLQAENRGLAAQKAELSESLQRLVRVTQSPANSAEEGRVLPKLAALNRPDAAGEVAEAQTLLERGNALPGVVVEEVDYDVVHSLTQDFELIPEDSIVHNHAWTPKETKLVEEPRKTFCHESDSDKERSSFLDMLVVPQNDLGLVQKEKDRRHALQTATVTSYAQPGAIGQFSTGSSENRRPSIYSEVDYTKPWTLEDFVLSNKFESVSTALNLTSALATALEVQYAGIEVGYRLTYGGSIKPAAETWPDFDTAAKVIDMVFGLLFTIELLIKVAALRRRVVKSAWNWLDMVAVCGWWFEKFLQLATVMNPMTMRLMRLAKLARIARKLKTVKALDSLQVLVGSIIGSLTVLLWSVVFLLICQMLVAFLLNNFLTDFMTEGLDAETFDQAKRQHQKEVYKYFGTFTRAMFTMFELTLGNWIPITRLLTEHVSEWWAIPMLMYKMFMGFAVVKVITGVFLHETFKVAATDDDLMVVQKSRAVAKYRKQMQNVFMKADSDGDGFLNREELSRALAEHKTKTLLSAMDLEVNDTNVLFDFIRPLQSETINLQDLTDGVQRLKGTARSIDVVALMRKMLNMENIMQDCADRLSEMHAANHRLGKQMKCVSKAAGLES